MAPVTTADPETRRNLGVKGMIISILKFIEFTRYKVRRQAGTEKEKAYILTFSYNDEQNFQNNYGVAR